MNISAKKILDSRKQPTIEVDYFGFTGSAPSGISTGKYEAKQYIRKLDQEIQDFNKKADDLEKFKINNFEDLERIEHYLRRFGANPIIALEFAILKSKNGYKWFSEKNYQGHWEIVSEAVCILRVKAH